jgi:hypothetical protein
MASEKTMEMESLNIEDLDVEGLERRLELAPVVTAPGDPGCPQDQGCMPLCTSDYTWRC